MKVVDQAIQIELFLFWSYNCNSQKEAILQEKGKHAVMTDCIKTLLDWKKKL